MSYEPFLFIGFNDYENNGDEVDASGVEHPPIAPNWFLSFSADPVLIVTPEMLLVFEDCADYTPRHENNTVTLPPEVREIKVRRAA